ncbi:enoyl-CoA hydratase/isomerase family protein [Inmirania thermothiophila]|nr:enoyl-CoA hydratase/isomerase family protein [Inmirania thermothiophila]
MLEIQRRGDVAAIRLAHGTVNAIGPALVEALEQALDGCVDAGAVILAGNEKFFSIGLALPELLGLGRAEMEPFWMRFCALVRRLYAFPRPTVCAVTGHATAGGAVLALACDFRVMAAGRRLIGLNEVRLGLPVPLLADLVLRQVAGDRRATELLYHGEFLTPEAARAAGIVDEVVPEVEGAVARAHQRAEALAALPAAALAQLKAQRTAGVLAAYEAGGGAEADRAFLDFWFEPAVQARLAEAAQRF